MEKFETTEQKKTLRKKFLKIRDNIPYKERIEKDSVIIKKILEFENFLKAKNVMMYHPFKSEVNLLPLIDLCKEKSFFFPIVDFENKELKVAKYNGRFCKNKFGIFEPENSEIFDIINLDIILIPGIVFDIKGYRIGYGGGYYDRFLLRTNGYRCGICYEEQIIDNIPISLNDVLLDCIISDKRIIKLR